jgi:hypothetical protein
LAATQRLSFTWGRRTQTFDFFATVLVSTGLYVAFSTLPSAWVNDAGIDQFVESWELAVAPELTDFVAAPHPLRRRTPTMPAPRVADALSLIWLT